MFAALYNPSGYEVVEVDDDGHAVLPGSWGVAVTTQDRVKEALESGALVRELDGEHPDTDAARDYAAMMQERLVAFGGMDKADLAELLDGDESNKPVLVERAAWRIDIETEQS